MQHFHDVHMIQPLFDTDQSYVGADSRIRIGFLLPLDVADVDLLLPNLPQKITQGYLAGQFQIDFHDPVLALNSCDKLLLLSEGSVLDIIEPKTDSLDKMEQTLSMIYGSISLQRCHNRKAEAQIVMLRED